MRRTVYLLIPQPAIGLYEYQAIQHPNELVGIPRSIKVGISVNSDELGPPPLPFPILRIMASHDLARIETKPQPSDQLIALIQLRDKPDFEALQTCTLEQALALCETYDSGDFTPV